jgi:hypothetical protein
VEALVVPITQVAVAPHQVDQEVALVLALSKQAHNPSRGRVLLEETQLQTLHMVPEVVEPEVSAQTTATLPAQVREALELSQRLREPLLFMREEVVEVRQTPTLLPAVLEVEEKEPLKRPMIRYRQLVPPTVEVVEVVAADWDPPTRKPLVLLEALV